jgi:hypothetical protein
MHSQETTIDGRHTLVNRYESLAEVTRVVREDAEGKERDRLIHLDNSSWVGKRFDKKWDGPDGLTTVVNTTWSEGMTTVDGMMTKLRGAVTQKPRSRRRRRQWSDETGHDVCYDRLRAGQEQFWVTRKKREVSGSATATIAVNVCAASSVGSMDILWRGAAALCLADLLTEAGYSVEIVSGWWSVGCFTDSTSSFSAVTLKRGTDRLDRSTLVNALSGWFFRTIGFGAWQVKSNGRTPTGCLGHPHKLEDEAVAVMTTDERAVVVDEVWNESDAVEFVRNALVEMKVL